MSLDSLVAGHVGSASVTFTLTNPLPADGHIIVEFPSDFSSINPTAASGTGVDGGLQVSVSDGYTVRVARDNTGNEVPGGTEIKLTLSGGIKNQLYEGPSSAFPMLKTTLSDTDVAIDEASIEFNDGDVSQAVEFVPGSFTDQPTVSLDSLVAGHVGSASVTFILGNPLPVNGHIVVEFPPEFDSIGPTAATGSGLDGSLVVDEVNGRTVRVARDSGTQVVPAGTQVVLTFSDGITNQLYEGPSVVFPLLKTTLANPDVAIDVASTEFNAGVRPGAVEFVPGSFTDQPTVSLDSLVAGHVGSASVTFTLGNPLPVNGHIVVEFPPEFFSIGPTAATGSGIDGDLQVFMIDGYTVRVERSGGTEILAGTQIVLTLSDGITNQLFEGASAVFPLLKTTLADTDVAIDEASSEINGADRPEAVSFAAASLVGVSSVLSYDVAGMETSVTFTFTVVNPLPPTGLVFIEFPSGFLSASPSSVVSGVLGTLAVQGSFALTIQRDGSGDTTPSGTTISLVLSTVTNRDTVGDTGVFSVTTFTESSMENR